MEPYDASWVKVQVFTPKSKDREIQKAWREGKPHRHQLEHRCIPLLFHDGHCTTLEYGEAFYPTEWRSGEGLTEPFLPMYGMEPTLDKTTRKHMRRQR